MIHWISKIGLYASASLLLFGSSNTNDNVVAYLKLVDGFHIKNNYRLVQVQQQQQQKTNRIIKKSTRLLSSKRRDDTESNDQFLAVVPKLIIFDLDGCLWKPEMYELLYFSNGAGGPFTYDPKDDNVLLTTNNERVVLLGNVRDVMKDLYTNDRRWKIGKGREYNTLVGISSRTNQPDWARELLQKFKVQLSSTSTATTTTTTTTATTRTTTKENADDDDPKNHDNDNNNNENYFVLNDIFQHGPIEIASDSKINHFHRIRETTGIEFHDMIFFDNEYGNCQDVSSLGVVVGYCPGGVTTSIYEATLTTFSTIRSNQQRRGSKNDGRIVEV